MNKKDSSILTFIKGFIIGLGVVFPISASVLAISMGIYKKLLKVINHFFKYLKKEPSFIISLVLGIIISVIVSAISLDFLMGKVPVATLLFFIGLVMGGMPGIVNKVKKKINFLGVILTLVGIGTIVLISLLAGGENATLDTSFKGLLMLLAVGIIGSGSMIVPGVSGSVMLIILGYYEPILSTISNFFKGIDVSNNFIILAVFSIGMLLGLLLFAKIIHYLLDKYETGSYFVIIGFIIASCMRVIISLFSYSFNILEIIIGIILLAIGFMISFKYLKEE